MQIRLCIKSRWFALEKGTIFTKPPIHIYIRNNQLSISRRDRRKELSSPTERTASYCHHQSIQSSQPILVASLVIIMPSLSFHAKTPSPASSPTLSPTPSIVLHPSSGILDHSINDCPSNPSADSASKQQLYKSTEDVTSAYRKRYAQYLASTFNMSLEAAMAEADAQLAPRRTSDVSEAETLRSI